MLNLNSIMLSSGQPKILAEFYNKVLGIKPSMEEDNWVGWMVGSTFLGIGPHSDIVGAVKEPARMMINFETSDVQGEFERIKLVGAQVVSKPYQMGEGEKAMWVATFSDPDGNYFQLMSPWKE